VEQEEGLTKPSRLGERKEGEVLRSHNAEKMGIEVREKGGCYLLQMERI